MKFLRVCTDQYHGTNGWPQPGQRTNPAIAKATFKQYRHSDAMTEFADRGHSLTIDSSR